MTLKIIIPIFNLKQIILKKIIQTNTHNLFELIAIFNDYLKFRMDFIAEIATD